MNEIDLTKLTVKQTPQKVIQANLDGTIKDYTIYALNESQKINVWNIYGSDDPDKYQKFHKALFAYGLGFSTNVTDMIFASTSVTEAVRVANLVWEFSDVFDKEKLKELEKAEKNLPEQTSPTPQGGTENL